MNIKLLKKWKAYSGKRGNCSEIGHNEQLSPFNTMYLKVIRRLFENIVTKEEIAQNKNFFFCHNVFHF